jgi:hypothetical protein
VISDHSLISSGTFRSLAPAAESSPPLTPVSMQKSCLHKTSTVALLAVEAECGRPTTDWLLTLLRSTSFHLYQALHLAKWSSFGFSFTIAPSPWPRCSCYRLARCFVVRSFVRSFGSSSFLLMNNNNFIVLLLSCVAAPHKISRFFFPMSLARGSSSTKL